MPSLAQVFWVSGALFVAVFVIGVWPRTGTTPTWFAGLGIGLCLLTVTSGLVVGVLFLTAPQAGRGGEAAGVDTSATPTVAAPVTATPERASS